MKVGLRKALEGRDQIENEQYAFRLCVTPESLLVTQPRVNEELFGELVRTVLGAQTATTTLFS